MAVETPSPSVDPKEASSIISRLQTDELEQLHFDLGRAREIQARLLPQRLPKLPGYDFAAHYAPAGELGGDFYDFIQFDRNTLGLVVADASGKGLSGALLMVEARAVMRSMASLSASPGDIVRRAHRVLLQDLKRGMFITLFCALLDLSKGTLKMASAGHTPMLLWRRATGKCYSVNPSGLALGMASEEVFNRTLREECLELGPGDRFVLYTDGVTELMDLEEDQFGTRRLVDCALREGSRSSEAFLRELLARLDGHRSGLAQSDDITIVTGRVCPELELL